MNQSMSDKGEHPGYTGSVNNTSNIYNIYQDCVWETKLMIFLGSPVYKWYVSVTQLNELYIYIVKQW